MNKQRKQIQKAIQRSHRDLWTLQRLVARVLA